MIQLISIVLSFLPKKLIFQFSLLISGLFYKVLKIRRQLVLRNLNTAFPGRYSETELDRIGFESVNTFLFTELEFLGSRNGKLSETVQFENESYMREVLSRGKGAYLLCIHMGSWEATGAAVTKKIAPAHVIVKKVGGPRTNAYIRRLREKNGFLSIKREKKGDVFSGISEVLAKGELVGFVMDQSRPGEPFLPFFGSPAKTNTSFAAIWKKRPAPIIPVWSKRTAVGRYTVGFDHEIFPVVTDDEAKDILDNSAMFNRVVESLIERCPEQYFWLHDRWKK